MYIDNCAFISLFCGYALNIEYLGKCMYREMHVLILPIKFATVFTMHYFIMWTLKAGKEGCFVLFYKPKQGTR